MAGQSLSVDKLIQSMIFVVVGVSLVPVLYTTITNANVTDTSTALMISLIPLFFVIGLLYATVKNMI